MEDLVTLWNSWKCKIQFQSVQAVYPSTLEHTDVLTARTIFGKQRGFSLRSILRSVGEGDNVELNQLINDNGYLPYRNLTFADILAAWKPQPKYAQSIDISTSVWSAPISDLDNVELNLLTFVNDVLPGRDECYVANRDALLLQQTSTTNLGIYTISAGSGAPQSLNPFLPN